LVGLHDASAALAAIFTGSIDLKRVAGGLVMVLAADLLLESIDLRREELDGASALGAHHVMMTAAVVLMLVAGDAIVKGHFAGQSAFGKELQRAIHSRETNARIALANKLVKLFRREVLVGFKKREQDGVALFRPLEADPLQMLMKTLLRLAQGLPRNRSLIINPLLQHRA
jgi:hypothetical protein